MRLGQQMLTFGAGFTAVPWQQDRIVTVQVWTVLLDVLTVYFPKHFATTALLLPEKKGRNRHVNRSPNLIWKHTALNSVFLGQQLIPNSSGVRASSAETLGQSEDETYRFAVALDTVHDTKGLPQIWMPCVLQGIKSASKWTSCKTNSADYTWLSFKVKHRVAITILWLFPNKRLSL